MGESNSSSAGRLPGAIAGKTAGTPLATENASPPVDRSTSAPLEVRVIEIPGKNTWLRFAETTIPWIAAGISTVGLLITLWNYQDRIKETNAKTIYDISREGRDLSRRIEDGEATTGDGIAFHFNVYYLQKQGVVDEDLRPLMILDLCSFIKRRADFNTSWSRLQGYFPDDFQVTVNLLNDLPQCDIEAIQAIKPKIPTLEGALR